MQGLQASHGPEKVTKSAKTHPSPPSIKPFTLDSKTQRFAISTPGQFHNADPLAYTGGFLKNPAP